MENKFKKDRFEYFFDAILAILITILILEFKVPHIEGAGTEELKGVLLSYVPELCSYIISFLTIVALWIDHHRLISRLPYIDKNFILVNFLFVLFLSPLSFTTSFAGEYIHNSFAIAVLAANFFLMNVGFSLVFGYTIRKKMLVVDMNNKEDRRASRISIAVMFLLLAAIPLAFVHPALSFGIFILSVTAHLLK